jgi:hypothetical protein
MWGFKYIAIFFLEVKIFFIHIYSLVQKWDNQTTLVKTQITKI